MSTATGVAVGVSVAVGVGVGRTVGCGVGDFTVGFSVGLGVGLADGLADAVWLGIDAGTLGVPLGEGMGSMTRTSVPFEVGDGVASTEGVGAGRGSQSGAATAMLAIARQAARPAATEREIRKTGKCVRTIGRSAING
jgi:hypothetical protein